MTIQDCSFSWELFLLYSPSPQWICISSINIIRKKMLFFRITYVFLLDQNVSLHCIMQQVIFSLFIVFISKCPSKVLQPWRKKYFCLMNPWSGLPAVHRLTSRCAPSHPTLQPHGLQPTKFIHSWDFPGKNTGMGCHFLLQGIFLTQGASPHFLCLLHWQQILHP